MKHVNFVGVALQVLGLLVLALFGLDLVFKLPNWIYAVTACISVVVAVGVAYQRRHIFVIACWTCIVCCSVLIGMELTFPDILGRLF